MRMSRILAMTFALSLAAQFCFADGSDFSGINVVGLDGKTVAVSSLKKGRFTVYIAAGSKCPILRQYVPILNKVYDKWHARGVEFYLINVAAHDDLKTAQEEFRDYKLNFPVFIDSSQNLARKIGFRVSSETAVVETATGKQVYRGAINDRYGFDGEKPRASKNYLDDVIKDISEGHPTLIKSVQAFGCAITYRR